MNNDRFKFRVWDFDKNKMIFPGIDYWDGKDFIIDTKGTLGFISDVFGEVYWSANESEFIKNQCTGMKDKNDALIYEGDIIAAHYPFDGELSAHSNKFYVKWIGYDEITTYSKNLMENKYPFAATPGFYLFNDDYKDRPFVFSDSDGVTYEIIGNIYENYDLLEKK